MYKKLASLCGLMSCLAITAYSQSFLGLSSMKYSGVHRLYLNPANAAGRSNPVSISIIGFGQTYDNTYAEWNSERNIITAILDSDISTENLEPRNNPFNTMGIGLEARGIGATFGIGSYVGIGITSRSRFDIQLRDTSLDLLESMRLGIDDDRWELNKQYTDQRISVNSNLFGELALTIAGRPPIIQGDEHRFYVGATIKYLRALAGGSINIEDMAFTITEENNIREMTIDRISGSMGFSSVEIDNLDLENPINESAGSGIGFDLGLAYEKKGGVGQSYKYRFGLSLLDIGTITYDNADAEFYSFNQQSGITFDGNDADSLKDHTLELLKRKLDAKLMGNEYTAYLPTTLILQADYSIMPVLYVGAIYSRRVVQENFSINRGDFASIIPRVEVKFFSLAMPITLKNNFEEFALGTAIRIGPFYAGADNWLGYLTEKNEARLQVYTGFSFNIGKPF